MNYEFKDCIGARLRRLSNIVDIEFRKQLASFDITENQMTILFVLSKSKNLGQGEIGKYLTLQRSTVSRNVKLMQKQDLVSKTEDYHPKIKLTFKGEKLVVALSPIWENVMNTLLKKIGTQGMEKISYLESKLL